MALEQKKDEHKARVIPDLLAQHLENDGPFVAAS